MQKSMKILLQFSKILKGPRGSVLPPERWSLRPRNEFPSPDNCPPLVTAQLQSGLAFDGTWENGWPVSTFSVLLPPERFKVLRRVPGFFRQIFCNSPIRFRILSANFLGFLRSLKYFSSLILIPLLPQLLIFLRNSEEIS